jgi:RHS repeat-associated protein
VRQCYDGKTAQVSGCTGSESVKGVLTGVASPDSVTAYVPDVLGRVTSSTQTTGGVAYNFAYTYNADGSLRTEQYPSGRVVANGYDRAARPSSVGLNTVGATDYASVAYTPHGAISTLNLGNGLAENWTYDTNRMQPLSMATGSLLSLGFSYGASASNNGNLLGQTISVAGASPASQSFSYDAVNRLSGAAEGSAWSRTFGYDAYGNMWVSAASGVPAASFTPQSSAWFNSNNRLVNAGLGIQHESSGELKQIGGFSFTYEGQSRLKSSTISGAATTYSYDGEGRRVKKVGGGSTVVYVYDAMGRLAAEYGGTVDTNGTQYLTSDHLGSTRLVTSAVGGVVKRYDYLPFGEEIPAGIGFRTTALGYAPDSFPLKFTGKERDAESNLDYFGARYFGAAQGRFTSADPLLASGRPDVPQSWNRYAYGLNNPLRFIDPTGLYEWDTTLGGSDSDNDLLRKSGKNKAARAAAQAIVDQRKAIRGELKRLAGSKEGSLRADAAAIGAEGKDNGVTISMGAVTPGAAAQVSATRPLTLDANGNPQLDLRVLPGARGDSLFIALAHEGSHVWDAQSVAGGTRPFLRSMETEMSAFMETVAAARSIGWSSVGPVGGASFWSSSWSNVDQQTRPPKEILKLLLTSPIYAPKNSDVSYTK